MSEPVPEQSVVRMQQRREELGLTQGQLADRLGMSRQSYAQYENNRKSRALFVERAELAAIALRIAPQWIAFGFGRSEPVAANKDQTFGKSELVARRLRRAREASGRSQVEAARDLRLARPTYITYENGETKMRVDVAERCARLLGVPPEWLAFEASPAGTAESFVGHADGSSTNSLAELRQKWNETAGPRPTKPAARTARHQIFDRNPVVVAIARLRADLRCEVPDCSAPLFLDSQGQRFVEVHHITTLANGGVDTPDNVVCLCPGHHREVHHGRDAESLTETLRQVRRWMA